MDDVRGAPGGARSLCCEAMGRREGFRLSETWHRSRGRLLGIASVELEIHATASIGGIRVRTHFRDYGQFLGARVDSHDVNISNGDSAHSVWSEAADVGDWRLVGF